jgi:hypothetical protein
MYKKILKILSIIILSVILIISALYWQKNIIVSFVIDFLNSKISDTIKIDYKSVSGNLLRSIEVENLNINFVNGSEVKIDYLEMKYKLFAMFSNKFLFSSIIMDGVKINLITEEEDRSKKVKKAPDDFLIQLLQDPDLDSLLFNLPVVDLPELEIVNGSIQIPKLNITLDSLSARISITSNSNDIKIKCDKLAVKWFEKNINLDNIHIEFDGNNKKFLFNKIQIVTSRSHIYGNMEISRADSVRFILVLDDIYLDVKDIENLYDMSLIDSGYIHLSSELIGSPKDFSIRLFLAGNMNQYHIDSLTLDGDYSYGEIKIKKGELFSNQSLIAFNGRSNKSKGDLNLFFKNFNLNNFLPNTIQTDLNGKIHFQLEGNRTRKINGDGQALFTHSSIDSVEFDTLNVVLDAVDSVISISESSYLRMGEKSIFHFYGELKNYKTVTLNIKTEKNYIPSLIKSYNIDKVDGILDANIFISGKLLDPDIIGFLWIPNLKFKDILIDSTILSYHLEKIFSRRRGNAHFSIVKAGYANLKLNEALIDVTFDSNSVIIDTLLFANYNNYITSQGRLDFGEDYIDLVFSLFRLQYQGYLIENNNPVLLQLSQGRYYLKKTRFTTPENEALEIEGFWNKKDSLLQTSIHLHDIKVEFLKQFLENTIDLKGNMDGNINIVNPFTHPELHVDIHGKNLFFNHIPLGNLTCVFNYNEEQLYFQDFNLSYRESSIKLEGDIKVKFIQDDQGKKFIVSGDTLSGIKVYWNKIDLKFITDILHLPRAVEGKISGLLQLTGTVSEPAGSFYFEAEKVKYDKFYNDNMKTFAHFNKDSIVLDNVSFDINGSSLQASGWQSVHLDLINPDTLISQRPFELAVFSQDNTLNFLGYFSEQIENIQGPYTCKLILAGTWEKPYIREGYFKLDNGTLKLSRIRNLIKDFKIDARIENSLLKINTLSGFSTEKKDFIQKTLGFFKRIIRVFQGSTRPEGVLSINGNVSLSDIFHPRYDMYINMYKFYVDYFVENIDVTTTTNNLHFYGGDTLYIKGDITINEGKYIPDLDNLKKNIYLRKISATSQKTDAAEINISIPGNFMISSSSLDVTNNFQIEIMGDLHYYKKPYAENFELIGHLDILSGKYGSWGQIFEIINGTIDFTNPTFINPYINIHANKRNGDYIIELMATGDLERLNNDIQVYSMKSGSQDPVLLPDLTEEQKFNILSIGGREFESDSVMLAGEGVLNTSVETMLERSAEKYSGFDRVEIQSSDKLIDLQSLKLNNGLKDAAISLGKYISNNLYLEYKSQFAGGTIPAPRLSWQPGNQVGLEYRINRSWSIDSHYSKTVQGNNKIKISLSWKMTFK